MGKVEQINVNTVSRISQGTSFTGDMVSPHDIRVDGDYNGNITSDGKVVIGETATFKGNIICSDLDFWGKVEGDVVVKDTLSLHNGCEIKGNLRTQKLYVEMGSSFNGNCTMIEDAEFNAIAGKVDANSEEVY